MKKHFQRELEQLKKNFISLSTLVEETVALATKAFREMDINAAKAVIDQDDTIDNMEIKIEEECLKLLALYQPVASDLRLVITILKINSDLERIGDLSVNIAKCASFLCQVPKLDTHFQFADIIQKTQMMLKKSIDSLVNMDTVLAYEVCRLDEEVDAIKLRQEGDIVNYIRENPDHTESMIRFLSVSRNLERIGDHATNIAEDVIYSVEGDIIRHHKYVK
jgi:phosphate transport system protein